MNKQAEITTIMHLYYEMQKKEKEGLISTNDLIKIQEDILKKFNEILHRLSEEEKKVRYL